MIITKEVRVNKYTNIHLVNAYLLLISFLKEGIGSESLASFESWFQSIAPLILKLLFRNAPFREVSDQHPDLTVIIILNVVIFCFPRKRVN